MTERLYYNDAALLRFDAQALDAQAAGEGRTAITLDRTAFYPTSGGQPNDTGWLVVGEQKLRVVDVIEEEKSGAMRHIVEGLAPQAPFAVRGEVDEARRSDHMQQHTGQHILSAAFIELFHAATLSFHLGADSCAIDIDSKAMSLEQLRAAESLANQTIARALPIRVEYASVEEARARGVRKIPPVEREALRLVNIDGFDLNACGGTHLANTSEAGLLLVRKTEKVKQGLRVEFVVGARAFSAAHRDFDLLTASAALYSTGAEELPTQIAKSLEALKTAAKREHALLEEIAELQAAKLAGAAQQVGAFLIASHIATARNATFCKLLAQKIVALDDKLIALVASDEGQPTLVFAQARGAKLVNLGAVLKQVVGEFGGRGGGSAELAQGGVARVEDLSAALERARALIAAGETKA